MRKKVIVLSKVLAEIMTSRDITEVLENFIKRTNAETVILDFKDIKFISRSAAHSLLLLKEKFEARTSKRKLIYFENAVNDVSEMLRIVSASKAYPKKEKTVFNPKRININSLLKEAI
jgi:anti-anti-sigma regulatory factor